MRKVSIVVPIKDERENLESLHQRVCDDMRDQPDWSDWELIVVDDHSSDAGPEIARAWAREDPRVRYVRLARNCGSHAAFSAGVGHSRSDGVVLLAADLQDPPEIIPELTAKWDEGFDVVVHQA